jgi:putative peptidoglycan lipid II flippase
VQWRNRFLTVAASAMAVSLLVQVLAFGRQLLIAAYFGAGREFDGYVMVFTVATLLVFNFAGIFDSVAVPRLVRTRETERPETALALARSIFRLSLGLGIVMSAVFLIAVRLFAPIFATGFSPAERSALAGLSWYFVPWTIVCVPYYAAAARYKMEWRFNRVFAAEIVIVVVSIAFLQFHHDVIHALPIAYACGYAAGLFQLTAGSGLCRVGGGAKSTSLLGVVRNIGELFLANQTGSLASLADRHIQSFLASGGITAVNYATQITSVLSSLLTMREIYVVPLTQQLDRAARLERLLSGLVVLAFPLAGLIGCLAPDIVQVLLQHGRFDAASAAMTAEVLRISSLSLVVSAMLAPLARMFQILDRIHYTHAIYLAVAVSTIVFGYLFVGLLGWGVRGVALMQLGSSLVTTIVTVQLVAHCGVHLRWSVIALWIGLAGAVTGIACAGTIATLSEVENVWLRIVIGGSSYGVIVLVFSFLGRARLHDLILGVAPPAANTSSEVA